MKLVTEIIKPFKLDEVRDSLSYAAVSGSTVCEVKGFGRQKGHTELYSDFEYVLDFLPRIKLEIAINDDQLSSALDKTVKIANTGKFGDGKIFVSNLEKVVKNRTGAIGSNAL